jgi:hypothetical protein
LEAFGITAFAPFSSALKTVISSLGISSFAHEIRMVAKRIPIDRNFIVLNILINLEGLEIMIDNKTTFPF